MSTASDTPDLTPEQAEQAERDRATLLAFLAALDTPGVAAFVADLQGWGQVLADSIDHDGDDWPYAGHPSVPGMVALFDGP